MGSLRCLGCQRPSAEGVLRISARFSAMKGGLGALVAVATLAMAPAALGAQETFNHTGGGALWTAPEGVVSATFDVYGGQGGNSIFVTGAGGLGGRATATLPVRPGRKYLVDVGGAGGFGEPIYMIAYGGSGSEVRSYPYGIEDRMIAAGGGGSSVSGDGPPGGVRGPSSALSTVGPPALSLTTPGLLARAGDHQALATSRASGKGTGSSRSPTTGSHRTLSSTPGRTV